MTQVVRHEADAYDICGRMAARCERQELSQTVRMMLGRYNQKPQGDPDLYVRQMTALFANYPAEVVRKFASPITDPLPASDFLPSVSTVREAADGLLGMMKREEDIYWRYKAPRLPEPDTGPTEEERDEIGEQMRKFVDHMKFGEMPKNASHARRVGLPEWMWEEHEQSDECKRMQERFARSQCPPGEAIRAHLARQQTVEDA